NSGSDVVHGRTLRWLLIIQTYYTRVCGDAEYFIKSLLAVKGVNCDCRKKTGRQRIACFLIEGTRSASPVDGSLGNIRTGWETSVIICRSVYLYYCSHVYKSLTKIPSDVLVYKFQFSATKFYFSISQAITALLIKNKMQIEK